MKYTKFGSLGVDDEFMMVNPAAYPNAVIYRKCSSTEAQHDALRPEPVGSHVVVWPVKVADNRFVSFREIPIGSEFFREIGGDRYQKIDSYGAHNTKTKETIPFGSRVAVLPVVSVLPEPECQQPAAVGNTDRLRNLINLTEKGYRHLTETGSLPVAYMGKTIEIGPLGRHELTVGTVVDAWLEWADREISAIEDKAAKEAESRVFNTFGERYLWTQAYYDTVEIERRNVNTTVRESLWQLLPK